MAEVGTFEYEFKSLNQAIRHFISPYRGFLADKDHAPRNNDVLLERATTIGKKPQSPT